MLGTAFELYDMLLEINNDLCNKFRHQEKNKMKTKPKTLSLKS